MSNANPTYPYANPNYSYATHCQLLAEGVPLPSYSVAPVQTVASTSVQAPAANSDPASAARGK